MHFTLVLISHSASVKRETPPTLHIFGVHITGTRHIFSLPEHEVLSERL